jgi:hypothetical protein
MKTTDTLRAAAGRVRDAEARHTAITAKLTATELAIPPAPDLAPLVAAHQDAVAALALGEGDSSAVAATADALRQARDAAAAGQGERQHAALVEAGLRRRLAAADAELIEARAALADAEIAWLRAELDAAESEYQKAAVAVIEIRRRHWACAEALAKRGGEVPSLTSYAAPLALPVVGPRTAELFRRHAGNEADAIGASLTDFLWRDHLSVEPELAALTETPQPGGGIVSSIRRALRAA